MNQLVVLAVEGEAPNPLIPHPVEIVVGLIAFALLYFFLKQRAFPMFEKAYRERTQAIEGGIANAEKAQAEAAEALRQYNAQLSEARGEAARIRNDAQSQRTQIVEEARVEARAEATRILEAASAQIASERQQALTELRREVGGLAVQLASRVVGESLEDEARQRRTVDRFLDSLDGASPTTTGATRS
jgi:F-type H+-transporting ATPase subunit b